MRYAGIIKNDIAAAPGLSVTFFLQGCPHRCKGCHNPETWDYKGGKEFTPSVIDDIIRALTANNIQRNLCIMGGEPLCPENIFLTTLVIKEVKEKLPCVNIYIWTGYTYEDLTKLYVNDKKFNFIINNSDFLIDGPYIEELRDTTLKMRGSSNQRIINLTELRNCDTI